MLPVVSHPEADEELEAAAQWYEQRQPELGETFLRDFEATLQRVIKNPQRWRLIRGNNHKLNFSRFPYAIVFSVEPGTIFLKAVMHLHRRPFYWKNRQ
jgi:plasmid stabilization system protein ParE